MIQRRMLPLLLAALLVFLSGCGDGSETDVSVAQILRQARVTVPTDHALDLGDTFESVDTLENGKLLYRLNFADRTLDQAPPDSRAYVYDIATGETQELGQILWWIASNDNTVFVDGKTYFSFDDYENESNSMTDGIKIVEVDMQNRTIVNRVVMAADYTLSNLDKISDTEFIYDVGQGVDVRNFSYYIYNTETNANTLFLTMQFNPETKVGKIPYRARRVGEEIWILVQTVEGEKQSNVLEKYSRDGKLTGTLPLPQEISPYIDEEDGESYRISDFKVRDNQYYFYSDGTGKKFYYTLTKGKFVAQTPEYGWGTLYPEADPQYVIYNHLPSKSSLFLSNQQTGETVQCKFQIDSEYNTIRKILFDSAGNSDQVALVCVDKAPLEPNAQNRYQVYFMNFSDVLRAAGLEEAS